MTTNRALSSASLVGGAEAPVSTFGYFTTGTFQIQLPRTQRERCKRHQAGTEISESSKFPGEHRNHR